MNSQAKDLALRRLSQREHSASEVYRYLLRKGISEEDALEVIGELLKLKLIDDSRYTLMMIKYQIGRGKGSRYIAYHLKEKGIRISAEEVQRLARDSEQTSELESAFQILQRKYPEASHDRAEANRAYQNLARRGFSYSVISEAIKKLKSES